MPKFYRTFADIIKQNGQTPKIVPREVVVTGSGVPSDSMEKTVEQEMKFRRSIKPLKFNF